MPVVWRRIDRVGWRCLLAFPSLALAVSMMGCGSDGASPDLSHFAAAEPTPEPTATPTPRPATDEEYARNLCTGMRAFFRDFDAATRAIPPDDPNAIPAQFAKALGGPLHRFATQMNALRPPAGFEEWHGASVESLTALAAEIQAGKPLHEIISLSDEPLPEPPPELAERLAAAVKTIAECHPYLEAFASS